jgi:hypothetical protein
MTVEWHEVALDRLADIYVAVPAADRDAVARCVEQINTRLADDSAFVGESRGGNRRVFFNRPLMVVYDLVSGGGVRVVHVSLVRSVSSDD